MSVSILLISDEDGTRDLLEYYLQTKGYDVAAANNKEKVLTLIYNKQFQLVLFDYDTIKIDSDEICQLIRQYSNIPIIFISDHRSISNIMNSIAIGGSDFIKKPDFTQFENRLKANLFFSETEGFV